jgi:Holliday junction resolvasome RuvABC endonuclease subunit
MIVARVATAAELLGGFKITLTTWCEEHEVPAVGYPIGTIKKHATGKGNAGKPAMIAAANKHFGVELDPSDYEQTGADNIADAMWICDMAINQYKDGI